MSKGNQIVSCRVTPEELEEIKAWVKYWWGKRFEGPPTVGEFLRQAIRQKIAHNRRSRKEHKEAKKKAGDLCKFCKRRPPLPGKRICVECTEDYYVIGLTPEGKVDHVRR